ncbi:MAG: hypothetical protein RIQ60_4181 [Pseudomonadota bacterium]|jgi:transposase
MSDITRGQIVRVGVDLAKRVIHVVAVDAAGRVVTNRPLPREKFLAWCAQLPAGCTVAMETCSGAHYWARKLAALGLQPKLIAGHFVGPYRMGGKTGRTMRPMARRFARPPRGRIPAAAKPTWAPSPNGATIICAPC